MRAGPSARRAYISQRDRRSATPVISESASSDEGPNLDDSSKILWYYSSESPESDFGDNGDAEWPVKAIVNEEITLNGSSRLEVEWENWERNDGTNTTWERQLQGAEGLKKAWMEEKKKERELKAKASPSIDLEVIASVLPHNIGTAEKKVAFKEKLREWGSDEDDWDWKRVERMHKEKDRLDGRISRANSTQRIEENQRYDSSGQQRNPTTMQNPSRQTSVASGSSIPRKRQRSGSTVQTKEGERRDDVVNTTRGEPSRGTSARSSVGLLSDQTRESIQRTWSKACKKVGAAAIVIVNEVDEEDYPPIPKNFIYMEKGFHYAPGVPDPHDSEYKQFLFGCECSKNNASCGDFDCSCVEESGCMDIHNNNDIAYNKDGYFRFTDYGEVIECNERCTCGPQCRNRVAQKPRKLTLELFKTEENGWGVRCPVRIRRGTVLGLYTGHIVPREAVSKMAEEEKDYTFDLDVQEHKYSVCSYKTGNWTRFVNHSCEPTAAVYPVVYETTIGTHMPYLAYVASEDIPARHEITIDYNPKAGLVKAGKKKAEKDMIRCLCRSERCRGFI